MISIALCTYNGQCFLQDQLRSIADQSLIPDELVVCDDVSKDDTSKIIEEFKKTAPFPVHLYANKKNLGARKNFERAISLCKGEIIALCDQDDVWKPQKLERIKQTLLANPQAGYVFSNAELVGENLEPLNILLWDSIGFCGDIRERFTTQDQFQILLNKKIVTGATMAFRAEVGMVAMPFPTIEYWLHDSWLSLVATSIGAYGVPIKEPLIKYRQHLKQQIGAPIKQTPKKKQSLFSLYEDYKLHHKERFFSWEKACNKTLKIKSILENTTNQKNKSILKEHMKTLNEFEIHYINRRKILSSQNTFKYHLILREALSGRYGKFSDSWRTLIRDTFL